MVPSRNSPYAILVSKNRVLAVNFESSSKHPLGYWHVRQHEDRYYSFDDSGELSDVTEEMISTASLSPDQQFLAIGRPYDNRVDIVKFADATGNRDYTYRYLSITDETSNKPEIRMLQLDFAERHSGTLSATARERCWRQQRLDFMLLKVTPKPYSSPSHNSGASHVPRSCQNR